MEVQPVFIIGAGRSGTKFLRSIISSSSEVSSIPYDVNYVWRYGNESWPDDEIPPEQLTAKIKKYIRKRLTAMSVNSGKHKPGILLEKSVSNSLRVRFVRQIFPEAKFIHLIRSGYAVTESAIRMWQAPPEPGYIWNKLKYFSLSDYQYGVWYISNLLKGIKKRKAQNIWGPRYQGIQDDVKSLPLIQICARQWAKCVSLATAELKELPSDHVFTLFYEDLIKDKSAIMKVVDFLNIGNAEEVLSFYLDNVQKSDLNKWKNVLSTEDLSIIESETSAINLQVSEMRSMYHEKDH